jgi:hypothetical protein
MHLFGINCNNCIPKYGIKNVKKVLSVKFCPLHQYSNHMLTVAGVWPDCRLQTNLFCWARQSEVVVKQHDNRIGFGGATDIVDDFYYLVWCQSRLLCCVCSDFSAGVLPSCCVKQFFILLSEQHHYVNRVHYLLFNSSCLYIWAGARGSAVR